MLHLISLITLAIVVMMIVSCLFDEERSKESVDAQVQIIQPTDCRPKKKGPKKLVSIKKKKKVVVKTSNNQMRIVSNRLETLEGALMEKDVEIRKLEKKVQSLEKKSIPLQILTAN